MSAKMFTAICAALAATVASAATAYLTVNDTYENSSFTNPVSWSVYGVPSSDNDYVVKDGHVMSPPMSSSAVFNGNSLRVLSAAVVKKAVSPPRTIKLIPKLTKRLACSVVKAIEIGRASCRERV